MNNKIIHKIVMEVCNYYNFTPEEVFFKSRKLEITRARQLCQYLIHKYTKISLCKVGEVSLDYGRKREHEHSTILNSIKSIENLLESDFDFYNEFQYIISVLNRDLNLPVYPVFNIKNMYSDFKIDNGVLEEIINNYGINRKNFKGEAIKYLFETKSELERQLVNLNKENLKLKRELEKYEKTKHNNRIRGQRFSAV